MDTKDDINSSIEQIKLTEMRKEAERREKRQLVESAAKELKARAEKAKYSERAARAQARLDAGRARLAGWRTAARLAFASLKENTVDMEREQARVWSQRCALVEAAGTHSERYGLLALLSSSTPSANIRLQTLSEPSTEATNVVAEKERARLAALRQDHTLLERESENGYDFVRGIIKHVSCNTRRFISEKALDSNAPIKFTTSPAARRHVIAPIRTQKPNIPWYQPFVVVGSVAVFLVYFCIFREENDVDIELTKTLYERIDGLERKQLLQSYQYNKENGLSVLEIEARLKELDELENSSK